MMSLIARYIFQQTFVATLFVTLVLSALIFFTQSLKFLDMVVQSGASGFFIWLQTLLYLPGFFEIIFPIGMVGGLLFTYNKLTMDSELIALRSLGFSPMKLAKPAITLAVIMGLFLFIFMGWIAPASKTEALDLRQEIKARVSTLIFREGIFNDVADGLMVYIRNRDENGQLSGLIIHDSRDKTKEPSTIIARRGVLVFSNAGRQVMVFDGSRQEVAHQTGIMKRLDFQRYTIDLPEPQSTNSARWKKPEERNIPELIQAVNDKKNETREQRMELRVELQKRFLIPFLVPGFAFVGLSFLLFGTHDRRGQGRKVFAAVLVIILLEVLFLWSSNLAKTSAAGFPLMFFIVLLPYIISAIIFMKDNVRQNIYARRNV